MQSVGPGAIIDQYTLIRAIGRGGFGTVWLARPPVLDDYVALKIIAAGTGNEAARELKAVQAYKKLGVAGLASGLLPVEHVGMVNGMVFYVMHLADGVGSDKPEDVEWKPLTLGSLMEGHRLRATWFSSQEIISYFTAICKAVQILDDAGLVHRDIKPDNILFVHGKAVLSDISLLTTDASKSAFYGTPGFLAPSYYLDSGGKIDMFSIAATLFTVLSGLAPDKIWKTKELWPPAGKDSLSLDEQDEWRRLHRVIFKATNEPSQEHFSTFAALGEELVAAKKSAQQPQSTPSVVPSAPSRVSSVSEGVKSRGLFGKIGFVLGKLWAPLSEVPLVVVLILVFLASILINVFIFRGAPFWLNLLCAMVFCRALFQGAKEFSRDRLKGWEVLAGGVIVAILVAIFVTGALFEFIKNGQTVITRYDEGWLWWRRIREVARVDESSLKYITCVVLFLLFFPAYAATPLIRKLVQEIRWPARHL